VGEDHHRGDSAPAIGSPQRERDSFRADSQRVCGVLQIRAAEHGSGRIPKRGTDAKS
jgi:hypothetical protein